MDDFCGSVLWNSSLTWNTENVPEFTECFHLTFLIWGPCIFLFLFTPLELYYIKSSKHLTIPWNFFNIAKLCATLLLIALCCVNMGMAIEKTDSEGLYPVHIVTPIIQIVTFILTGILVIMHKNSGIRSAGLMFLFWLLLLICAIPQYYTEIKTYSERSDTIADAQQFTWENYQFVSYMIYFPLVLIMLIFNCFSDKASPQTKKSENASPELGASFLRKLFFQWFDSMTWKGYRQPLEISDMWDINPEDESKSLVPKFNEYWYESVAKNERKNEKVQTLKKGTNNVEPITPGNRTNGSILPAMVKAFGGPFWFAGILKLATDLLSFASPQLLGLLINFTASGDPVWKGIVYAVALFLVSLLTTFLNGQYMHRTYLVGFRIRSALISGIYRKSLRVSTSAKKESTVGEIVNLMAVDAHRFFELVNFLHLLWSGPLIIALALYFLWDLLGPAVMAGLAIMILTIPLNVFIATKLRTFQIKQMKKKDERVKGINEILNGIKVLKLYAWETSFEKNIYKTRDEEVKILKNTAYFSSMIFFVWTLTPFLVTLASFATFVLTNDNILTPAIAFMALSLFNILRNPMGMFPMVISMVMQAWVSITRINKFMNNEELDPNNVTHNPSKAALLIENGTFTWGEEEITLKNINLEVEKKSLTAVVGPVGSGKSSLISALIGEMEKKQGHVNTDGSIAYVSQQAWIQNATLQNNVLFGKPMDKVFYESVLEACALKSDIEMLPGGDQTEIGEKGINLSGGQKQRVSLARAVYNNADIYFLDDPLSAVDSHVGKHIFDNVIGPNGILAAKTRLLVTHGISFLPQMDNILVINNGEISESGSYKTLLAEKGVFADFLIQHLNELDEDDEELEDIKQVLINKPEGKKILERAMSIRSTSSGGSVKGKRRSSRKSSIKSGQSVADSKPMNEAKTEGTLIEKEESATGSVSYKVYIRYFRDIGVGVTIITLIMYILNQGFSVYSSMWLTDWSSDPDANDPAVRDKYLGVYGAFGAGQAISLLIGSILLAIGCLNAAKTLHNKLLSHSLRLPMSFFDTTPLGRIMNRFSKDVDMVDNTLPMSIRMLLMMFFNVIAIFVVISISSPLFIAVIVPIAIIYYIVQKFYVATSRQLKRIESVTRSPIYSHFGETLTGQSTIRAYNKQQNFIDESEQKVDFNQMCSYPSIISNRWLGIRLEMVGSFVILFAALFAVLGRETMDPAIVGLSVSYSLQITMVLNFLVRMTTEVETNIVAIERMEEYADLPQEAPREKGKVDPLWPQEGKVAFHDFQVRYREGLDLVLKGISFSVNGSEKIGIVGRTGAGKSSLTLALFRIIEAADGKIVIDEKDISELGLQNLRSRLTIIPQDPVLFSGTLRMNIDPFDAYKDDDIWRALELSHLKAFVKSLPAGLLHEIAEGGDNLSVGQRQLICLARALLRKTKVLILDEATAAVDLETDDLIQKTIRTEFSDCTILTIAHRLNTILDSDKVIVLDKGQIAEFDTPQNLLNDKNSIFYSMAKDAGLVNNNN